MLSKEDCAVYLHTVQTNVFKALFETLKELLGDVNMVFDTDGVRITEMDPYQTCMVDMFLDKEKLEDYYCPKQVTIGISIPSLQKRLKNLGNNQVLTMYMTKDNISTLEIVFDSTDSTQQTEFGLDLMDLENDPDLAFPDDDYKLVLSITASEFKQICTTTKSIDTKQIKITYSKGVYVFSAKGLIGNLKITHLADNADADGEIYEGVFDLEKLSSFTKCANLC